MVEKIEKDESVVQSIKKLLSLKLSDEDILDNLMDAGLEYDYAKDVLAEVKQEKETVKPVVAKPKVSKDDDVDQSVGVWQEGVLTIVNQKLDEISEKERNIEKIIKKETQGLVAQEIQKLKVVLDSQRSLLVSKINSSLTAMVADSNKKVNDKLDETSGLEDRISKKTEDLMMNYKLLKELKDSISKEVEEFPKMKEEMFSKFDAQTAKIIQSADSSLRKYEQKYKEIDAKLNNTLSLASKIVEGLVETGKKKIDDVIKSKANSQVSGLDEKIKEMEIAKSKIIKEIAKFEALREEYEVKFKADINVSIEKYIKENMDTIVATIAEKQEDAGFDTFKTQIGNLVKKLQKEVEGLKEDILKQKAKPKATKSKIEK